MKKESNRAPPGPKPPAPPGPPYVKIGPPLVLHTHPRMEKELGVPEGHVIIDKDILDALRRRFAGRIDILII